MVYAVSLCAVYSAYGSGVVFVLAALHGPALLNLFCRFVLLLALTFSLRFPYFQLGQFDALGQP